MPNFRYRALAENGKIVSGLITAPSLTEVARRIDYLRLVPIDPIIEILDSTVAQFQIQPANSRGRRYNFYTRSCAIA